LLFTAFEPSGDEHASAVIAELRRRHPHVPIFAWGGPKMQRAGATIVERTGDDAVMGLPGPAKIAAHVKINRRIDAFLRERATSAEAPITVHVPVDSPAANGPICRIARRHGLKVVHLVAPQIWAWGRWRIHKLRRMTDLVLCMLPFEEEFFRRRRVPARFVGHFLFDHALATSELDARAATLGDSRPRIAMMPGSRPNELMKHFPILLDAFDALRERHPGASGVVAATSDKVSEQLRRIGEERERGWPESLRIVVAETDAVIRWCDVALVKSGTVTLQVAKQARPMVIFYKRAGRLFFAFFRLVATTRHLALPNLLANERIVPELIPHLGDHRPLVDLVDQLLKDPAKASAQREALERVTAPFRGLSAAHAAADAIEQVAGLRGPATEAGWGAGWGAGSGAGSAGRSASGAGRG
jgi:lipid-A-disaccharide synthase